MSAGAKCVHVLPEDGSGGLGWRECLVEGGLYLPVPHASSSQSPVACVEQFLDSAWALRA